MTSSTDIYEQGKMFTTKRLYVTSFRISTTEEWQLLGTVDPNTLHTTTP